jgi:hypothetical protein
MLVGTPGPASARPRPRPHAAPFPEFSVSDVTVVVDFQQQQDTLVFPAGSTAAQSVVVTVVGDETVEPDETFHVQFAVADDAATLDPSFATVTIVDDDSGGGGTPVDPL